MDKNEYKDVPYWFASQVFESVGGIHAKDLEVNKAELQYMFELPQYETTPDVYKLGSMYYDTVYDCARIYTKKGWQNVNFT